jgi:hypothetical protein
MTRSESVGRHGHRSSRGVSAVPLFSLCLLVLSLLGISGEAGAQGRIHFSRLEVSDCEEIGTCEWRLSCQIGGGKPVELLAAGLARGAEKVEIGRAVDVRSFPVKIQCTLEEDDGWFGTEWEAAGTATAEVPAGGDYSIVIGNPEQGKAEILLVVDSLEIAGRPPAAAATPANAKGKAAASPAAGRTFAGVYQKNRQGHAVVVGLPWDAFKARVDQLAAQGSMLAVVDSYVDGGKRLWTGIFRSGPKKQELVASLEFEAFTKKRDALIDGNMRLFDLSIHDDTKAVKRYFTAVFHEGTAANPLVVGLERKAFEAKMAELSGREGLRLIDLEPYRAAGGKVLYTGAFLEGKGSYGLRTALDWDAMVRKQQEGGRSSAQVVDLETYMEGGKRLYDAALRGGEPTELTAAAPAAALAAEWKKKLEQGMRLIDLETIPD